MDTKSRGSFAENYAAKLLSKEGYKVIGRNFYTAFSEIDIIAVKDNVLIFVEVKARWGKKYGKPEESVNPKKLYRIERAGELFRLKNPNLPKKSRIEVVALEFDRGSILSEKIIKVY